MLAQGKKPVNLPGQLDKEIELHLNELHQLLIEYSLVAEASIDVIFRLSLTGKLLFISQSCKDTFGYETEEVIGQSFIDYLPKSESNKALQALSKLFKEKETGQFQNIHCS